MKQNQLLLCNTNLYSQAHAAGARWLCEYQSTFLTLINKYLLNKKPYALNGCFCCGRSRRKKPGPVLGSKDLVLTLGTLCHEKGSSSRIGQEECSGQCVSARVSSSDHGHSRRSEPRKINVD